MATLPDVTHRQRRVAAIAGGLATIVAIGGFAALLAFAPRETVIREAQAPAKAATQTAAAAPSAPSPEIKPTNVAAASVAAIPAIQAPATASTATATSAGPADALPVADPRWGDMTVTAEAKAAGLLNDKTGSVQDDEPVAEVAAYAGGTETPPSAAVEALKSVAVPAPRPADIEDPSETAITAAIDPVEKASGRPGVVKRGVNLRAKPSDGSKVLMVLPAKASLTIMDACKSWCQVQYKGTTGYVYKSFLR